MNIVTHPFLDAFLGRSTEPDEESSGVGLFSGMFSFNSLAPTVLESFVVLATAGPLEMAVINTHTKSFDH